MRRVCALVLIFLFALQGSASAGSVPPVTLSAASVTMDLSKVTLQPIVSAIQSTWIFAMLTGQRTRYDRIHAPAFPVPKLGANGTPPRKSMEPHNARTAIPLRQGVLLDLSWKLPRNPGADLVTHASSTQLRTRPRGLSRTLRTGKGLIAMTSTLGPSTTGVNPWWTYAERPLAGIGKAMINVATGNLIVQSADVDISERGIDLAFQRSYNAESQHDASNSDGSTQSLFGNGWTNTFDAHIAYNAAAGVMSVYDIDGARYDYTLQNGNWTPPAGMQATSLFQGGSGIWWWTKANHAQYGFFPPDIATEAGWGPQYAAYAGRISSIWGRNWNNHIWFQYSWNGPSTTINNLTKIVAQHSDGQALTLNFAAAGGPVELQSIVLPDGHQITYTYDASGNLVFVTRPGNANNPSPTEEYHYSAGTYQMNWVGGPRFVESWNGGGWTDGSNYGFTYDAGAPSGRLTWISDFGKMNFTPDDGTGAQLQSGASMNGNTLWRQTEFQYNYNSEGITVMTDTQGHEMYWQPDALGRVFLTAAWAAPGDWLVTSATWDTNLNVVTKTIAANTDPHTGAPAETDYTYDGIGDTTSVTEPWVQTNQGWGRPTARYVYDSAHQYAGVPSNNVVAYCDPVSQWSTSTCTNNVATTYTYDYSDPNEPFGRLTDTYNPMGYHRHISYGWGGLDFVDTRFMQPESFRIARG